MLKKGKQQKERKQSIGRAFIVVFIVLIFTMAVGVGYLVFSSWHSSVAETAEGFAEKLNQETLERIDSFIREPLKVNEASYTLIQNDIVDFSNRDEGEKFLVGVLTSYSSRIYNYGYCTADGDYYAAIKYKNGSIEILRINADTNGELWNYEVNGDMTTGKFLRSQGKRDMRESNWFQTAINHKGPAYSPVFNCSQLNDMVAGAVYPIYSHSGELEGVLTAQLLIPEISERLVTLVKDYSGWVAIVEKDSGYLLANSDGAVNYTVGADKSLKRKTLESLDNTGIQEAYQRYSASGTTEMRIKDWHDTLFVKVQEYDQEGLNWVILSAVPESSLTTRLYQNIYLTVALVCATIVISIFVFLFVSRSLLKPVNGLLRTAERFSAGDLSQRVPIVRNDEIGRISAVFNNVADAMQHMLNHLNETVAVRTAELNDSKEKLLLILNSTAEAIYGTDMDGKCTFCNESCLKMLGYSEYKEVLGKNIHQLIHHTREDGSAYPESECPLTRLRILGKNVYSSCEVFWKADGTHFDVEYHALPQIRDGKNIGSVVSFLDITERKKNEEQVIYLSCHDSMTGLLNRGCFERMQKEADTEENLPISMIYIDLNGLKIMNDTFGHACGDELIRNAAVVLKGNCRKNDFAARVGGDEFCVLLPQTKGEEARRIAGRLKAEFARHKINSVSCSMAVGVAVKWLPYQKIEGIMEAAETEMYREKSVSSKSFGNDAIKSIIAMLHEKCPQEKVHSEGVSRLCSQIGAAMHLPESELQKLREAAYLHDIGKIAMSSEILAKDTETPLAEEERYMMREHCAIGYRILSLSEETLNLANGVYGHHEAWDGSGYPKGLVGEEIPLISRIIAVAGTYERIDRKGNYTQQGKALALRTIREGTGIQFDPHIAELLLQIKSDD